MCCKRKVSFLWVLVLLVGMFGILKCSIYTKAADNQETVEKSFSYTGGMQSYIVPKRGIYKLEVWGAQGGGADGSSNANNHDGYLDGGRGGYSYGYLVLDKDDVLYICVGGEGGKSYSRNNGSYVPGGYNGGGNSYGGDNCMNAAGGGATSIASISGTISQIGKDNLSKIYLIAGGGGGASNGDGATCRCNGGGGGGPLGGYGYSSGSITGEASQTSGYAFGQGANASGSSGSGGGGGLYGGYTSYKNSGGGGSGYIGGVPTITVKGNTYSSESKAAVQYGNGKALISLVEELEYVTIQETSIEKIERQQVQIHAQYKGMVSYTWQRQEKSTKDSPLPEEWVDIDESDDKFHITEEKENDIGKTTLTFEAERGDGNYWYRVKMIGEEQEFVSDHCDLHVIPLKKSHFVLDSYDAVVEVGDKIKIEDLDIQVVFNNEDVMEKLQDHPQWKENMYFIVDGNLVKEYIFTQVSQSFQIMIHMEDSDNPQDLVLLFDVQDHGKPEITDVEIDSFDYEKNPCDKEIVIHVTAKDLSDGELEYWYVKESDGQESEHNHDGKFDISLSGNDKITIYVKDQSGNIVQWEQEIHYVDSKGPEIVNVITDPEKEWKNGNAKVTVSAEDALSGLHENAYSFDGGKSWQKEDFIILEDSTELIIVVRDLVENLSEEFPFEMKKSSSINVSSEVIEEDETILEEEQDDMLAEDEPAFVTGIPSSHRPGKKVPIFLTEEQQQEFLKTEEAENDKVEFIVPDFEEDNIFPIFENGVPLDGNGKRKTKIPFIPLAATITAASGGATGGFVFVFFWIFRRADIYWIGQSLEEELAGSGTIFKRRKHYLLKLKSNQSNFNRPGKYILKTSKRFCRKNREKYLDVVLNKEVIQTLRIQENMYYYVGSRKGKKRS